MNLIKFRKNKKKRDHMHHRLERNTFNGNNYLLIFRQAINKRVSHCLIDLLIVAKQTIRMDSNILQ